jgi:hypothetical protein
MIDGMSPDRHGRPVSTGGIVPAGTRRFSGRRAPFLPPGCQLSCRSRGPAPGGRHDRQHDSLDRPARSGQPGYRPCHGERVLARSVGRGPDLAARRQCRGDHHSRTRRFHRHTGRDRVPISLHRNRLEFLCISMPRRPATPRQRSSTVPGYRLRPKADGRCPPRVMFHPSGVKIHLFRSGSHSGPQR